MNIFSNIEEKLKMMKPKPISRAEKNVLWSKIKSDIEGGQRQPTYFQQLSMIFGFSRRFVLASFLIFILMSGSAATVAASDNAKPGDFLFPIDTAIEKIQLTLTTGKNKDTLRIKFAQERIREAKIVLALTELDDFDEPITTSTNNQIVTSTATSEIKERKPKKFNSKNVVKTEDALSVALDYLEEIKGNVGEEGNAAASTIDGIIGELKNLVEDHIADLDEFETKIKANGNQLKVEIKNSTNKLKNRFKLKEGNNNESQDNGKVTICHIPPGNPDKRHTIEVGNPALQAHLDHGDTLGACSEGNGDNGSATSTPDVTAPLISNLSSSTATTTADITWTTDEPANSKAWYGTTTPLVVSEAPWFESSSDLVTNHHLSLLGLTASTTYYFIIASADEADNLATSAEFSLATLAEEIQEPVDTIPPILSDITSTSTTATSTIINWSTNEEADSKVWYNISTPLVITTSTLAVSSPDLTTNHNLTLTDLTASSTYYYLVVSTDTASNTTISTEQSFMTLPE